MYLFSQLFDEQVDVIATPVIDVLQSIIIKLEFTTVGNDFTRSWIRIKIIVDVQTIHIIATHNVVYHLINIFPVGWVTRVENKLSCIRKYLAGLLDGNMIAGQSGSTLGFGTIRINPCVQFHSALMTLFYHPLQWIPKRVWCLSLHACQETTPWFITTLIERIALGPHLEDDGIDTILLQFIQLITQRALHVGRSHSFELPIYTLNPSPSKLTFLQIIRLTYQQVTTYHE